MSRPSSTDARYQRYADIWECPETEESIERGWRVLHHEFMEGWCWRKPERVTRLARDAQDIARQRAGLPDAARARGRSPR